jgi:AcrR family transcriptional regulator
MSNRDSKSAPPKGPKFRRRAEARPDEVLDAAQMLFTERGYGATSVAAIAKAAGISKGAVYLYFPSKQAILAGLVERAVGAFPDGIVALAAQGQGSVREGLAMLLTGIAMRLSNPATLAVPKIVIHEALTAPEVAQMYREKVLDRAMPAMEALIRRGIASGELREIDPELTTRSVIGPVITHLLMAEIFALTPADGLALPRLIENHLTLLFDGMAQPGAQEKT